MEAENTNTTAKTKPAKPLVTEATKEAFLLFQEMQKQANENSLKLGAKVLNKPRPFEWDSTDRVTGEKKHNISYRLTFGFTGGSLKEKVSEEVYHSASVGDSFLLEGYIKATGEQKFFKDKESGTENEFVTITLNPEITKITPLNTLTAFGLAD